MSKTGSELSYVPCEACRLSPICEPVTVGSHDYDFTGNLVNRRHYFKRGEMVFRQGEPAQLIYAISAGSLKLVVNVKGAERVIDFRIPGELVDICSLDNGIHTYSAQALEDTYLCEIGKETLTDIASQIPEVQGRMMTVLNKELSNVQKTAMLLRGNVNSEEKLAAFILNLACRFQASGFSATEFKLTMTRADIADFLGLAKETIIRLFKKLQENRLLVIDGKQLTILDIEKLQHFIGVELIPS